MFKILGSALIYRPIFNILIVLLFLLGGNLGVAIIILTLLIRATLWNTTKQQSMMQQGVGDMQGKLKEMEEKYKDQPDVLMKESMKIMKQNGAAPLKGCVGLLVQIPVFLGLLYVIRSFASGSISTDSIYSFLIPLAGKFTHVDAIQHWFLGLDLFAKGNRPLTIIGAIFVYIQTKLTMMFQQKNAPATPAVGPGGQAMPDMQKMMGPMNLFMVFMMGSFIYSTPNGVGIYLLTTTIFSVVQYSIQNRELLKLKWLTRNAKKTGILVK